LKSGVPNKNTVARLETNILHPPKFCAGYASAPGQARVTQGLIQPVSLVERFL